MMVIITVLAGDFKKSGTFSVDPEVRFEGKSFYLRDIEDRRLIEIPLHEVESINIVDEETIDHGFSQPTWGGILLGPAGVLFGLLQPGREKVKTFAVRFVGGQRVLAAASAVGYNVIQAELFENERALNNGQSGEELDRNKEGSKSVSKKARSVRKKRKKVRPNYDDISILSTTKGKGKNNRKK